MNRFRDYPIAKKLNSAILVSSLFALISAGTAIMFYEVLTFRKAALHDLEVLAGIVASNSTGALAFQDAAAANNILANLSNENSILAARLYSKTGLPLATYVQAGEHLPPLPERPGRDGSAIGRRQLYLFRSIRFKKDPVGSLFLLSSLREMRARLLHYSGIIGLVILLLIPLVLFISRFLQRLIASSITDLAKVASQVAEQKNYSIRARLHGQDEIGKLTQVFNHMLESIEERDTRLVQQAEELWKSNKELEQFAYVSSHDLQEPLRKITVYAELLEEQNKNNPDENTKKFVENIYSSASRMRTLIQDLLTYSRLGREGKEPEPVKLNDVVSQIVNDMETTIKQEHATIRCAALPVVQANTSQMYQLFQNLIANAIKFHGAQAPVVDIGSEERNGEGVLFVKDNGIGIDQKYSEQIFKVFQRLHGREAYPGTGVGLAICKKIVEASNGRIWMESEPGHGSTFFFTLNGHSSSNQAVSSRPLVPPFKSK